MKEEKGITIVSLIIYVGVLFIVVMLVGRITGFFYKNADTVQTKSSEADFNKLNLYMLEETKRENTRINSIGKMEKDDESNSYSYSIVNNDEGNAIQFYTRLQDESGEYNVIGQAGSGIYYNKIKLCSDVDSFAITKNTENGKDKISITIKFNSEETYTAEYTMRENQSN